MSDISNVLKGYGVGLEQKAVGTFGAVVGNYTKNAGLGELSDPLTQSVLNGKPTITSVGGVLSLFGIASIDGLLGNRNVWQSPKYAADLIAYAPKSRFIFKVKFYFNPPYGHINKEFMYVVKSIDKPKVTFEYEDINMYNFRTKVLKSIRHEPLQMQFHDDIQNKVLDFFNTYRTAHSPISSTSSEQSSQYENMGMEFYEGGAQGVSSASMGILENGQKSILNRIEILQIYGHGTRVNTFVFNNPRIENFDFDNLDHELSEGNALVVSFNYDSLYIKDDVTHGNPMPWGQADILGNSETPAGGKIIGSGMGSSIVGGGGGLGSILPSSSIPGFKGGFPDLSSPVISSASSIYDSTKSTLSKMLPSVNQSSAGINSIISGFGLN